MLAIQGWSLVEQIFLQKCIYYLDYNAVVWANETARNNNTTKKVEERNWYKRHFGPYVINGKRKKKENNLTVRVTCWKISWRDYSYVFSVLKIPVLWRLSQVSSKTAALDQQNVMSSCCSLDTMEGSRPFSPMGASPVPIFSDSPVEVTLVHWRCELFFFFFWRKNYI